MRSEWMFPTVLIALDVCAALVRGGDADSLRHLHGNLKHENKEKR